MVRNTIALAGAMLLAGCSALGAGESRAPEHGGATPIARTPDGAQCLAELGGAAASFTLMPDQYFGNGCSNLGTVKLSYLAGDLGDFGLSNIGPVTCPVANAFAAWARYGVDRAARQILGSPLRTIETYGSYSCRNVAGTSRRSGHATADAIDIAAFVLEDGRRISVLGDWHRGTKDTREFLRVVHQSACKRFATVLGPDYNAAHANHLHIEGVAGGQSYCR